MFNIPVQAERVLDILEKNGYEGYIVGGCVRDFMLGKTPSDYDITTNALPYEVERCFKDFKVIETGIKHGTVSVLIDGMAFEITTYRVDGEYKDCRRPENVEYTSKLEDDLSRRDFTINAMAYSSKRGIVDIFGGKTDIENKIIRCVGEPEKRFSEDALRIMRAVRFSSQLGFSIDKNSEFAMFKLRENLKKISAERIRCELDKMLMGKNVFDVLMQCSGILEMFIPEIGECVGFDQHSPYHKYTVWEHTAHCIKNSPQDIYVRLTMLFHDMAKPVCYAPDENGRGHFPNHAKEGAVMAETIMKRLKYDNYAIKTVKQLIKYHDEKFKNIKSVKRVLAELGEENFQRLMQVIKADNMSKHTFCLEMAEYSDEVGRQAMQIINEKQCIKISQLAVNGTDLKNLGLEGRNIGKCLEHLLNEVIEENIPNEKQLLLEEAANFMKI